MLGINLSGPFYCSQAIVPKMVTSGGGSIINVCSIASYRAGLIVALMSLQNLASLDLLVPWPLIWLLKIFVSMEFLLA